MTELLKAVLWWQTERVQTVIDANGKQAAAPGVQWLAKMGPD